MGKKTALLIILIFSAVGAATSGKKLFTALNEYKAGEGIYEEISEIAYATTQTVSTPTAISDITEITLTPEPEEKNLSEEKKSSRRAVNGTWNKVGTPFMDFRNSGDFSDRINVIYGHYMGDGSMFTDIHSYKSQKFYDEHPYIDLYTLDGSFRILPVAGVYQNVEYWDFTFDYESDNSFLHQIDTWKALSTFKSDTAYDADDRFVVLTLCTYDVENSRFLLIGKLEEFVY